MSWQVLAGRGDCAAGQTTTTAAAAAAGLSSALVHHHHADARMKVDKPSRLHETSDGNEFHAPNSSRG